MQNIGVFFNRQLRALADELSYQIDDSEVCLYLEKLQNYGLEKFAQACLCFREDGYQHGTFPSVSEFEKVISKI